MSKIIEGLNEEQNLPALAVSGAIMVTAGAGSGKTRLLTHRIAHLVSDLKVAPYRILAITFTNKATNEMRNRLSNMVERHNSMWIYTFHSMCSRILRTHIERIGFDKNFTIYGEQEKERTLKSILKTKEERELLKNISWHISNAKNLLLAPLEYKKEIQFEKNADFIIEKYASYQDILKTSNALDFDDLLFKTYELFVSCKDILELYSDTFLYIHVDEFQDTNFAQYKLVQMLSSKHKNIFVVGDEDQCIYSWRGADFSNINNFKKDYDNVQVFKLERNYRSQKRILDRANQIIKNNSERVDKVLWTDKAEGEDVSYFTAYNDLEEAEWIAQKIKDLIFKGFKFKDICVLMRVNALSRAIEEKFLNYQIPYQVFGGFKFFERKEIKDLIAYLKIITNPKDNDSLVRVFKYPKKGIGDVSITKILDCSIEYNLSAFDVLKRGLLDDNSVIKKTQPIIAMIEEFVKLKEDFSLSEITEKLIIVNGLKISSESKLSEEEISHNQNIDSFLNSTAEFEKDNPELNLEDFLQSITLSRDIDDLDDSQNFVSVMTVHSAKGLEYKVVFVIGLCDGLFPLSRAIFAGKNELEEERRLMYVATTRAEELLFYSRPTFRFSFENKRLESTRPSRFLEEAGFAETIKLQKENENGNHHNKARVSFFDDDSQDIEVNKPKITKDTLNNYSKFKRGVKVSHPSFGTGEVIVEVTDPIGAFVTIRFDNVGIKTLSLKFAPLTII